MLTKIKQRLMSNTYRAAMVGLAITTIEINSGAITALLPPAVRPYAVMLWPMLMLSLREITTGALSDK